LDILYPNDRTEDATRFKNLYDLPFATITGLCPMFLFSVSKLWLENNAKNKWDR